jgi:hypothetical protein
MSSPWEPCKEDFKYGDIVRWTEAIRADGGWRKRKRAPVKLGERTVTAQVLEDLDDGFVRLEVIECKVKVGDYAAVGKHAKKLEPLMKDEKIRRKRTTIAKGGKRRVSEAEAPPRLPASKFT